jgi:hypothetical protein
MSPNVTFSLCAATGALLVSTLSAVKGRWAVAIVFGLLVLGFLVRALEGRRDAAREKTASTETRAPRPAARRIKGANFKRR